MFASVQETIRKKGSITFNLKRKQIILQNGQHLNQSAFPIYRCRSRCRLLAFGLFIWKSPGFATLARTVSDRFYWQQWMVSKIDLQSYQQSKLTEVWTSAFEPESSWTISLVNDRFKIVWKLISFRSEDRLSSVAKVNRLHVSLLLEITNEFCLLSWNLNSKILLLIFFEKLLEPSIIVSNNSSFFIFFSENNNLAISKMFNSFN